MVSQANRRQAWLLLWEANHLVRYWTGIHQKMSKRHRWILGGQAVLAAGAGTALVAEVVSWIAVVANVGVVAFMVSSMVRDHSGKLWAVREVRARCDRVQREARMLWTRIQNHSISDQIVEERWADLQRELDEATGTMADLATKEDLNIQAAREATSILEQEYARQN